MSKAVNEPFLHFSLMCTEHSVVNVLTHGTVQHWNLYVLFYGQIYCIPRAFSQSLPEGGLLLGRLGPKLFLISQKILAPWTNKPSNKKAAAPLKSSARRNLQKQRLVGFENLTVWLPTPRPPIYGFLDIAISASLDRLFLKITALIALNHFVISCSLPAPK